MDLGDKIAVTGEIFRDLEKVMKPKELVAIMNKLRELERYSDEEISQSSDFLCSRIFWWTHEKEQEQNRKDFEKYMSKQKTSA